MIMLVKSQGSLTFEEFQPVNLSLGVHNQPEKNLHELRGRHQVGHGSDELKNCEVPDHECGPNFYKTGTAILLFLPP